MRGIENKISKKVKVLKSYITKKYIQDIFIKDIDKV